MSSSWITISPRLQQGLEIVVKIENGKLRVLVNRICQSLHTPTNDKIFSTEEVEKLLLSLNLERPELNLLIDTITLIYSQAAFGVVKPAIMESVMKDTFPLPEEKITIFVNAWITYAKMIIEALRRKSIFPTQVNDINWQLNVQASSPANIVDAKPVVLLQLGLDGTQKEKLTVEIDKSSASDLYDKLEKIQSQLDALK